LYTIFEVIRGLSCDDSQSLLLMLTRHSLIESMVLDMGLTCFEQYHSCAVLVGGAVKCWGNNLDGQVMSSIMFLSLFAVLV
jgi:hypothetical protein